MKKRTLAFGILFILMLIIHFRTGNSSEARFWTESERKDLERGTLERISVLSSGGLTLSPKIKPLNEQAGQNPAPFFWCQAADSAGNLYIGSGNSGSVFKIARDGKMTVFFSADEPEVTALAVDRSDNVYAGTSPQGKIYRISKGGEAKVFCEPEERYIWAFVFDSNENLYAATGERGLILKVLKNGEYQLFTDSEEPHIVSLAIGKDGSLLAGSEGRGIVYRISPGGKADVLFSSGGGEISSIAQNQNGAIYFSVLARKEGELRPSPLQLTLRELISAAELERKVAESAMEEAPGKKFSATLEGFPLAEKEKGAAKPRSSVYVIASDGELQRSISFPDENILALCPARDGKIYIGTGEPGRVYRLEEKGKATLLRVFTEAQVTSVIPLATSDLSLITSNMGKAYLLSTALENTGTFISRSFDAGMRSEWGKIRCVVEQIESSKIELFTRSGNTESPDAEWSEWSRSYNPLLVEKIESPPARYIQWKARFSSVGSAQSAVLRSVTIPYLQFNEPPEMKKLSILKPGQKMETASDAPPGSNPDKKTVRVIARGEKGISWEASDPNGDTIRFTLAYRSEKQTEWMKIDEIRMDNSSVWNNQNIPDGRYLIRIRADDSPSNFRGDEKYSELSSEPFIIDNTPPEMTVTKKSSEEGKLSISLSTRDATGTIQKLLCSTDQRNWSMIRPDDRICDSSEESFQFSVEARDADIVYLKCIDDSLNEAMLEVK